MREAQKGIAFAAYLKLLMPLIVVLPGIAAVIMYPGLTAPDKAYPSMMALMPEGIKGLVFAALVAAIVSSLASMTNSISTIFTMDLYRKWKPEKTELHYVHVGRAVALASLCVALIVAEPLLGKFDQAFQYIQEFTGFFTPGIVVIFVMGMFRKRATSNGALAAAIGSAVFSLVLKFIWPTLPFMDRVGLVFLLCLVLCYLISVTGKAPETDSSVDTANISFTTDNSFNLAALGVVIILTTLYVTWW